MVAAPSWTVCALPPSRGSATPAQIGVSVAVSTATNMLRPGAVAASQSGGGAGQVELEVAGWSMSPSFRPSGPVLEGGGLR
jgi:hypothetical protein